MRRTFPFNGFSYDETTKQFKNAKRTANKTNFAVCCISVQSSDDLQVTAELSHELTTFQVRNRARVDFMINFIW